MCLKLREPQQGFLGGSGAKNPPANAGDPGSIPGLGKLHMQQNNQARVPTIEPVLQSLRVTTTEPTCPRPVPTREVTAARSRLPLVWASCVRLWLVAAEPIT